MAASGLTCALLGAPVAMTALATTAVASQNLKADVIFMVSSSDMSPDVCRRGIGDDLSERVFWRLQTTCRISGD
jgi:hypothetical protein